MAHPGSQIIPQTYAGYPNPQNPLASPVQTMHRTMPQHQMPPSTPMGARPAHRQTPSYGGYPQNQMYQVAHPQPSPLSQSHSLPQYGQQHHQSPMGPPQMPQQMSYQQMGQMGNPAFSGMNRSMYQPSPSPQQFNMQSNPTQQPGMQGWSTPGSAGNIPQDWQRFQ